MKNRILTFKVLAILAAVIQAFTCRAQDPAIRGDTGMEAIELNVSEERNEEQMETLNEELQQLLVNPLPVNSDEVRNLCIYGLISEQQYFKLREYRFRYGKLLSVNELQSVEGWDLETMLRVLPFVTLENNAYLTEMPGGRKLSIRQECIGLAGTVFEKPAGYLPADTLPPEYAGNSWKFALRYDLKIGKHVLAGFRAEKDPGETVLPYHGEFLIGMNFPDFFSGYVVVREFRFIRRICIGDYRPGFGRGITLNAGGGYSSWKDPFAAASLGIRVRQNTSMAESGYFRGAEVSLGSEKLHADLFYSRVRSDPSGFVSDTLGSQWFTGWNTSGYHRTVTEQSRRGALTEFDYGGMAEFKGSWFATGIIGIVSQLSLEKKTSGSLYTARDFQGRKNLTAGCFAEAFFGKSTAYAECSYQPGHKTAFVAGCQSVLAPDVSVAADFRHFPAGFQPGFHAYGAGPYGSLSNETGLSLALDLGLPGKWKAKAVVDAASRPWFSYQVDGSSRKYALHLQFTKHAESMDLYLGNTIKSQTANGGTTFSILEKTRQTATNQAELRLVFFHGEHFRFKSRLCWISEQSAEGKWVRMAAMQQEIHLRFERPVMKFTLGGILFGSEDEHNGIYMYEPDLLYVSGSGRWYGSGIRSYLIVNWTVTEGCQLALKLARAWYPDKNSLGSGAEELKGNDKTEIRMQLAARL